MEDLMGSVARPDGQSATTLERVIRTTCEELWGALTNPERAARWLGSLSGDLVEGGHYELVFDTSDPDGRVARVVLSCTPPHELVVTWSAPGESTSRVSVTLSTYSDGTLLDLVHAGLRPPVSDTGHAAGWHIHLDQLTAGVERNRWQDLWGCFDKVHDAYVLRYPSIQEQSTCRS